MLYIAMGKIGKIYVNVPSRNQKISTPYMFTQVVPKGQMGRGIFTWLKKLFRSPVTHKIVKGALRIGKAALPSLEKSILKEVPKKYAKVYKTGKNIAKKVIKSDIHRDVYDLMKGRGNPMYDALYGQGTSIAGQGTMLAGQGKPKYKKHPIDKYSLKKCKGPLSPLEDIITLAACAPKKTRPGIAEYVGKKSKGEFSKLTIDKIKALIMNKYIPAQVNFLVEQGFKKRKNLTKAKLRALEKKLDKKLTKQNGGWIGAALGAASLIPVGIELASTIIPLITSLFTKGTKVQYGSGNNKKEIVGEMGKDIAMMLAKEQSGEGLGDVLKTIGKTGLHLFKKFLPVAGRLVKAFAPTVEKVAISELSRSKKGKKFADVYKKGKAIGQEVYTGYMKNS